MRVSFIKVCNLLKPIRLYYSKYSLCVTVVQVTLKFTYVENYPDEVPLWEVQAQENLEDRDTDDILSLLQQQVCSGIGHTAVV